MELVEITKKDFLHKGVFLKPGMNYQLMTREHLLPLNFMEIDKVSKQIPIRFVKKDKKFHMVGVYGLELNENVWISNKNLPLMENVPSSSLVWPFLLRLKAGKMKVFYDLDAAPISEVYDDEAVQFFENNEKPVKATRFFENDGEPTEFFKNIKIFLKGFDEQTAITNFFISQLERFNLLEEIIVDLNQWKLSKTISGLWGIDLGKLYELPDEAFLKVKHLLPSIHHITDSNYHFKKTVILFKAKQEGIDVGESDDLELGQKIFHKDESINFDYKSIL